MKETLMYLPFPFSLAAWVCRSSQSQSCWSSQRRSGCASQKTWKTIFWQEVIGHFMALSIWQCEAVAFLCSKKTFTENRQLSQINWQFHETNHLCRIWCKIEKQITCRAFRRFLAELEALVFPWTCSDMSVYNKKKIVCMGQIMIRIFRST